MESNGHPSSIEVFTHTERKRKRRRRRKKRIDRQLVERNQRGYLKENPISKSEELSYFQKEKIS